MTRKTATILLTLMFIMGMLVACGGNKTDNGGAASPSASSPKASSDSSTKPDATNSSGNGEKVTIRMNMDKSELTPDQVKEFNSTHPNITLEQVQADDAKMSAMLASGDAPDIIRVSGTNMLPQYVLKGLALDLTPYFANSQVFKKDDLLSITNVYRFDGTKVGSGPIYGLPKDWSPNFNVFINKKMFADAGIPAPDQATPITWDQLWDLGKKLTKMDGKKVVQYGVTELSNSEAEINTLQLYLQQRGKDLYSSDLSKADFTQPEVKAYMTQMIDVVKNNVGPNNVNQDTTAGGWNLFVAGKAAISVQGYWITGLIRSDEKAKTHLDDYVMLPAPVAVAGGKRMNPAPIVTGAIIYSKTKHPKEAWEVFEWFMGGKPAADRASSGWGVPALKSLLAKLPQDTGFDKQTFAVLQDDLKYTEPVLTVNPYLNNPDALFQKYIVPLYFDKGNLDNALKQMNTDASQLIEEGKNLK